MDEDKLKRRAVAFLSETGVTGRCWLDGDKLFCMVDGERRQ